jgi:hypothetical protein
MSLALHQIVRVVFKRFKAFESFTLHLRHFNILVGPNNAGKSTILTAFRILAAALRKANSRNPELVPGPNGDRYGYGIDLTPVSVGSDNIFYNYDDSEPAQISFKLSNNNELLLYFPERGSCYLIADSKNRVVRSTTIFKSEFNCPIGFVPILGPVDENEQLYEKEAARLALFNYRAARNFRNIWYHFPEKFSVFREALSRTWPGMDVEEPRPDYSGVKPRLHMFCPEERIPREIFWAGFGFQVWCQMLTHVIQSDNAALFLIDEPDIYLHADLQRQLLGLLRNLGPDILIATHSTEIITEAEPDDIVLISKKRTSGRRIKHPTELTEVFTLLGSNLNPILTQLAKTRRVLFVEGKDFQILGRFATKLGKAAVGARSDFAVVTVEGFNPERIKNLKSGMETTLGSRIKSAAILDRDYRSSEEAAVIQVACGKFCEIATVFVRKEIENYLLVPDAIERAARRRADDRHRRTGEPTSPIPSVKSILMEYAADKRNYVLAQTLAHHRRFQRGETPTMHEETMNENALDNFEQGWKDLAGQLAVVPGKEALSFINQRLQEQCKISVTPTGIIDAMSKDEVPDDLQQLIEALDMFSRSPVEE